MDWLTYENLASTIIMGFESVEHLETKGPNSLLFNYKDALSLMLTNLQSNLERIDYKKVTKKAKSNDESSKLRASGNKWFSSSASDNAFDKALEFYTKSIAYALPNSEEMALSYANRSAVLFKMNCYQECLDNIERALPNYPDHLKPKLYNRQAECYSKLAVECKMEAKVWLDKVPAKDSNRAAMVETLKDCPEKKLQNFIIYKDCVIPEIKNPSKRYSCASDAVEVGYSEQFGRHIVATRNIDVGEVLIVERPYFRFLHEDYLYSHCSFCKTFLWNGIPCDECVNSVYCSEDCKSRAWIEYHDMECAIADLMRHYDWGSMQIKSTRLLLQMHHEAGDLPELKKRVINILGSTLDAYETKVQDEWYQGAKLESILCLISHEDKLTQMEFQQMTMCTLRVMFYLLTCTDFFGVKFNREKTYDVDIINFTSENSDFIFVGRLLIKLYCIIKRNSYTSYEMTETDHNNLGTLTAGLLSLLNSNCYPNTRHMQMKDHLVTLAKHPIKKGEQIFTCYCGAYNQKENAAERQLLFQKSFFFTCNCIACTEDWPMYINEIPKYVVSIEKIWQRCQNSKKGLNEMAIRVLNFGHYRDIDELLISFHKVIRAIYKEIGVNSKEMRMILKSVDQTYSLTGNVKKYRNLSGTFKQIPSNILSSLMI